MTNNDNIYNYNYNYNYNLEYIINNINNYFIDSSIIIKDNDNFETKTKNYLLKYKRIIGLVLLILLLIIGYKCDPYNIRNINTIQYGGSSVSPPPVPPRLGAPPPLPPPRGTPPTVNRASKPKDPLSTVGKRAPPPPPTPPKKTIKDKVKGKIAKSSIAHQAGYELKKDKAKAMGKAFTDKSKEIGKKALTLKTYTGSIYDAGAGAAHKFTDNADLIYQIFYAFALFILVCIITIPAIAFVVVGLICFVLLKDKIKAVKDL